MTLKGEAEAFATEAKAKAESEQMAKKADAWNEYEKAAITDMILQVMPQVIAEVSAPLSRATKITMVSDGNTEFGASRITKEVIDIVDTIPELVTGLTGVNIKKSANF